MLFNSYSFIFLFLPLTIVGYVGLSLTPIASWATRLWLVLTSLFFYGFFVPEYVLLLTVSIAANYALGQMIKAHNSSNAARKRLLIGGVTLNLGLLCYFKYFNFILDNLGYVGVSVSWPNIVLPIAISFFTFQQIAYLADTYSRKTTDSNFLNYCLFVSFFPQLIAGPIVHHSEMMPQFAKKSVQTLRSSNLAIGLTIFTLGLFKKVVIADSISVYATPIFLAADSGAPITTFEAWGAALSYTMQLYYDFSGYSDMAIGLARIFGIRLPLNFFSPYKARNIIDFWRRWHMTLSRFLRDYVYIPLGGSRRGESRRFLNLFVTMLIGGIWHGAGWNFLIWGGLHGFYLVVNHWFRLTQVSRIARVFPELLRHGTSIAVTFFFVVLAWVFFRATTMDGALAIVSSMLGFGGITLPTDLAPFVGGRESALSNFGIRFEGENIIALRQWATALPALAFLLLFTWFAPNTQQVMRRYRPTIDQIYWVVGRYGFLQWRPTLTWAAVIAVLAIISITHLTRATEFLYFQF